MLEPLSSELTRAMDLCERDSVLAYLLEVAWCSKISSDYFSPRLPLPTCKWWSSRYFSYGWSSLTPRTIKVNFIIHSIRLEELGKTLECPCKGGPGGFAGRRIWLILRCRIRKLRIKGGEMRDWNCRWDTVLSHLSYWGNPTNNQKFEYCDYDWSYDIV